MEEVGVQIDTSLDRLGKLLKQPTSANQSIVDERKRAASLLDGLRRTHQILRVSHEKMEAGDLTQVLEVLGEVLRDLLLLRGSAYETLCRETCAVVTYLARVVSYRGGAWAMVLVPTLLRRMDEDNPSIHQAVCQSLCALASHCYDAQGSVLFHILQRMEDSDGIRMSGSGRKQYYHLIKVVIEKWPPSCVQPHMLELCHRLRADIQSTDDGYSQAAMQGLVTLSKKWPGHGADVFKTISRESQVKLLRAHPEIRIILSPRRIRRRGFSSSSSTNAPKASPASLSSTSSGRKSSRRSLPLHPRDLGLTPTETNNGKGNHPPADPEASSRRLQQFINWKMQKSLDSGLAGSPALRAALDGGVSEDDLTADDGSSNNSAVASPALDELQRRKLNMMSPTLRQYLSKPPTTSPMTLASYEQQGVYQGGEEPHGGEEGQVDTEERVPSEGLESKMDGQKPPQQHLEEEYHEDAENSGNIRGNFAGDIGEALGAKGGLKKQVSFSADDVLIKAAASPEAQGQMEVGVDDMNDVLLSEPSPVVAGDMDDDASTTDLDRIIDEIMQHGDMAHDDEEGEGEWDEGQEDDADTEAAHYGAEMDMREPAGPAYDFEEEEMMEALDFSSTKKNLMHEIIQEEEDEDGEDDEEADVKLPQAPEGSVLKTEVGVVVPPASASEQPYLLVLEEEIEVEVEAEPAKPASWRPPALVLLLVLALGVFAGLTGQLSMPKDMQGKWQDMQGKWQLSLPKDMQNWKLHLPKEMQNWQLHLPKEMQNWQLPAVQEWPVWAALRGEPTETVVEHVKDAVPMMEDAMAGFQKPEIKSVGDFDVRPEVEVGMSPPVIRTAEVVSAGVMDEAKEAVKGMDTGAHKASELLSQAIEESKALVREAETAMNQPEAEVQAPKSTEVVRKKRGSIFRGFRRLLRAIFSAKMLGLVMAASLGYVWLV